MTYPRHVEVRALTRWNGQQIEAREYVPPELWADLSAQAFIRRRLRGALAQSIADTLSVAFIVDHEHNPFPAGDLAQDQEE
ncbi:hypothetical protein U5640_15895 [Streptomyces sp. SS7]|uniref:hypothetical protein n=1 Tax=Streptomyces sp. SS7 TaxID=3108485 RepID=UPI0030ECECB5